jgi:outer membrane protein assembly factor BamD
MQRRNPLFLVAASFLAVTFLCGFRLPFHKKKYEAPITKETQQPDKVLFDRAIKDIEKGNYLTARLTLNTLINTYDTSEYLAKAKLAIADSWYREGDAHGLAQAEIDYKDFILFFPNMEEAAESQYKLCGIHYQQMSKPDRDSSEAQRAEDECRALIVQFPNSKFTKAGEQKLRDVQEVLADKEMRTGQFYYKKGSLPAAQSRFAFVTQQYPLYSAADEALWESADSFHKMGDRFENQEGDALTKIVRDYPASVHVDAAKSRLTELKRPIPEGDPAAYARMKYDIEHRTREGMWARTMGVITGHPDVGAAAKNGAPAMSAVRPTAPVSIPAEAAGSVAANANGPGVGGVSDVGIGVAGNSLEGKTDARLGVATGEGEQKASVGSNGVAVDPAAAPPVPLPTNHPYSKKQLDELKKQQDKATKAREKAAAAAAKKSPGSVVPPATPPAAATTGTTPAPSTPAAVQQ